MLFHQLNKTLTKFILLQERRDYSPYSILIFSIFTGLVRGLEEMLLFDFSLKNSHFLGYIPFYLSIGYAFTAIFSKIIHVHWKKISKIVLIAIFLGIFPPIMQLIFSDSQSNVKFDYYFYWNLTEYPWLLYSPKYKFVIGESIVLWATIVFSGVYVYYRKKSLWAGIAGIVAGFVIIHLYLCIMPMVAFRIFLGEISSISSFNMIDSYTLQKFKYFLPIVQLLIIPIWYFLFKPGLAKHLLFRINHIIPMILISYLGILTTGDFSSYSIFAGLIPGFAFMVAIIQNDFYDTVEDSHNKRRLNIENEDVVTFNILFIFFLVFLFVSGILSVIPLIIFFIVSILYNYPLYRGKKHFPANSKIEGVWGACAFLSGALFFPLKAKGTTVAAIALMILGGWSVISNLKDLKDFKGDFKSGVRNLYIVLFKKLKKLRIAYRIIMVSSLSCLMVPLVFLIINQVYLETLILFVTTLIPLIFLSFRFPDKKWFQWVLALINLYLAELIAIEFTKDLM